MSEALQLLHSRTWIRALQLAAVSQDPHRTLAFPWLDLRSASCQGSATLGGHCHVEISL